MDVQGGHQADQLEWIWIESPIKEYMAQEGKQLILTSFGEMTENMLNAGRGAFSWWNLLQAKSLYRSRAGSHFYGKNMRFGLILGQLAILKKNLG